MTGVDLCRHTGKFATSGCRHEGQAAALTAVTALIVMEHAGSFSRAGVAVRLAIGPQCHGIWDAGLVGMPRRVFGGD